MIYEIEITRFAPGPIVERYAVATSEDAARQIQLDHAIELLIFVTALDRERNVDWGNFCVWCNAERARVQLNEHREHYATDPLLQPEQTREVRFRDELGGSFSVPYQQTVTRDQALAALRFWLPSQEHTPELAWS